MRKRSVISHSRRQHRPSIPQSSPASQQHVDFLVIGAGIAGLSAAIRLSRAGSVLVVTKEELAESNTAYAQGGIAVAIGGDEDVALHFEDTLAAGDGLVNPEAARVLVEQGPQRVEELLEWGTDFDRENGELMLTREGAHSRSRILHANGDATGKEIAVSLLRHVRTIPNIRLMEWTTGIDLLADNGRITGATLLDGEGGILSVHARATLLASGGAGQVYSDTTNPAVATGDGIAMAYRAGAAVSDMEFYQFHPTAFSQPGAPRFLMSEALRGEGAYLVNAKGERFMQRYHPLLELAPRDVVARAITREGMDGPVYLDMRHVNQRPPRALPRHLAAFSPGTASNSTATSSPCAPQRTTSWAASSPTSTAAPRSPASTPLARPPAPESMEPTASPPTRSSKVSSSEPSPPTP